MKFIITWSIPKSSVVAAEARFLQTGAQPPASVKMIGRWHGIGGRGVIIAETDNAKHLFSWLAEWNDLLEFEATPCLEDGDAGQVLSAVKR
jgi:hypothetical protein